MDVVDFGQSLAAENEMSLSWTDRLGIDTKCRENDAPFFIEMSFHPNEEEDTLTLCPRHQKQVAGFRRKRTSANPSIIKNASLSANSVAQNKKEFFDLIGEPKPGSDKRENDILKTDDRQVGKIKKFPKKHGGLTVPIHLVRKKTCANNNNQCIIHLRRCVH